MIGVQKTLEVIQDIGDAAVGGVALAKAGFGWGSVGKVFDILKSVKELIEDVPGAIPEMADLDTQESAQLGAAAYSLVKRVIEAVKA